MTGNHMQMNTPKQQLQKILLSILLFTWTLCVFMPGSYNVDSWNHYNQMIHGSYHDWLGPALPFTWRILWLATGGFASLYVFQMLIYWVFITMLLWQTKFGSLKYWVFIILGLLFVFVPQYIMRDSLMTLCWGAAALLLLNVQERDNYKSFIILVIAFLLIYGLWLRPNVLIGIIPLIWAGIAVMKNTSLPKWKHLLLSAGLCGVFFFLTQILTYSVLNTTKTYPAYILKLLDLSGISKLSGKNQMPGCIKGYKDFNYDTLLKDYTPATIVHIYWPVNNPKHIFPYADAELNKCVDEAWKNTIREHPLLYLQNRTEGFLYYLHINRRVRNEECWNAVIWIDPNNPLHLQEEPSRIHDGFLRVYDRLANACFFDPWFWLLLNITAFFFFIVYYRKTRSVYWYIHSCIQLSGVLYMLSQFLVYQDDREFRFTYWNVFVALIALSTWSGKIYRSGQGKKSETAIKVNKRNFFRVANKWVYYLSGVIILSGICAYYFINPFADDNKTLDYTYFNKQAAFNLNRKEVIALWGNTPVLSGPVFLDKGEFKVSILSKGTAADSVYPHINVFVNSNKIGEYFTPPDYKAKDFYFEHKQKGDVVISFLMDNDFADTATHEDRNAFVQYIYINKADNQK